MQRSFHSTVPVLPSRSSANSVHGNRHSANFPAAAAVQMKAPAQGVFQFNTDLILAALNLLWENIFTIGIGAGAIFAFQKLYRKVSEARNRPEEPFIPDRDSIADVARVLNMTTEEFSDFLYRGAVGDNRVVVADLIKHFGNTRPYIHGVVPEELIGDLRDSDLSDIEKLDVIFERINTMPFHYTGVNRPYATGFVEKHGDCNTLAQMMAVAAEAIGIHDVIVDGTFHSHITAPGPVHGRTRQGNTLNDEMWFFYEHSWCVYKGHHYDVLFNTTSPVDATLAEETIKYEGVLYLRFPGNIYILLAPQTTKYLKYEWPYETLAIVMDSEEAIIDFINQHR